MPADLRKLDIYEGKFEIKMALEKTELFNIKNLEFNDSIAEGFVALSPLLMEELGVENGNQIKINEHKLEVAMMKKGYQKNGKLITLHPRYKQFFEDTVTIEKL